MTTQDAYYRWVTRDRGQIGLEVTYRGGHVLTHTYATTTDVDEAVERFERDHAVLGVRRVSDTCRMCGWTTGTNRESCGECARVAS